MVKVKDTLTFIERARQLHGSRYDYSVTQWAGANKPIDIICKVHGKFTLAWADSHYKKKGSGCQKCSGCEVKVFDTESFIRVSKEIHGDRFDYTSTKYTRSQDSVTFLCNLCGSKVECMAGSHIRGAVGCSCQKNKTKLRQERQMEKTKTRLNLMECRNAELKKRPCKYCGKPIGTIDSRQVVCSRECGFKSRTLQRLVVNCLVCNSPVTRTSSHLKTYKGACCSLECQRQRALKERHSSQFIEVDWHGKSLKAKRKWKALDTRKRKANSTAYKYWLKCNIPDEVDLGDWERRCNTTAMCLKERFVGEIRESKFIKTWNRGLTSVKTTVKS